MSEDGPPLPAEKGPGLRRATMLATFAFIVAVASGLGVVWLDTRAHHQAVRREAIEQASAQAGVLLQRLNAAISPTYALAAVLRQNAYTVNVPAFELLAHELLSFHPGVSSLQYAPGGILTYIVPMAGNEAAVGHNLLTATDRNKEARLALETRQLTVAGPFQLLQGGVGLAARLPVFRPDESFWGFAVALIRVDGLLRSSNLERLERAGYDYVLWRVHPDTGKPHVFGRSGRETLADPVSYEFDVPNGRWILSIEPRAGWLAGERSETILKAGLVFVFATMVGGLVFTLLRQPLLLRREVALRTAELGREIAVRRDAEAQLRLAAKVVESSGEAIVITDAGEHIVSVNPAFTALTGYTAEEAIGRTPAIIASGRHDGAFFAAMREALAGSGRWQGEVWNRRKNGEVFPQWLGISALRDAAGEVTHFVSISSDISERKAAEDRINYLAHYDALSGLPNRLLLRDRVQHAIQQAGRSHTRVAVLSIDLDRFKNINDSFGHELGDALLRQVVARLKETVRSTDTISRQGGDEFVIVAPDHEDGVMAAKIAQKIQDRLAPPFSVGGRDIRVTASIGIALYPDDGDDFETLLKKGDIAMYHAKASGRATYRFFADATHDDTAERLSIEADIARGLERGEFVLFYQPQVELEGQAIVGAEALIRWLHPERGLVPPGSFIAVAEDSGLIVQLGEWVLREACRQIRAWQVEGLPVLTVSVNLSGLQFRRPGLVAQVAEILATSGVAPGQLELELTESILLQDAEQVLQTVRELKALGVRLAIDDFGTGYSSLSYLKRFAVDKLKIDRSFVRDICTDADDAAIVRAVIELGRSLNLQTIAEGAETADQVQILRVHGCIQVQGYYFSRPLPAAEFAEFVRESLAGSATGAATGTDA